MAEEEQAEKPKVEKKKADESIWSMKEVPTQMGMAFHNKETNEFLDQGQALLRLLENVEVIKKSVV